MYFLNPHEKFLFVYNGRGQSYRRPQDSLDS
jgi:hypothetical protein